MTTIAISGRVSGTPLESCPSKTWVNAASEMVQNSFMAEKTAGANAWVIGAAASAVAGLALLGFSLRKKQSTVVEV